MQSSPRIDELRQKFHENPRRYFAPLANEYRKAGDPEQAIAICRAHLAQQPGHMSGHVVYGQALYDADRLDEARVVFQQALALDPENLVVLRHLGDIARRRGDAAEARTWYARALDGDPQDAEVAAYLAELTEPLVISEADESAPAEPEIREPEISEPETPAADAETPQVASTIDEVEHVDVPMPAQPDSHDDSMFGDFSLIGDTEEVTAPSPYADVTAGAQMSDDSPTLEESPYLDEAVPIEAAMETGHVEDAEAFGPTDDTTAADEIASEDMEAEGAPAPVTSEPEAVADERPSRSTPEFERTPIVTRTLAELYLQQGYIESALEIYRQLAEREPGDTSLRQRISELSGLGVTRTSEWEERSALADEASEAQPETELESVAESESEPEMEAVPTDEPDFDIGPMMPSESDVTAAAEVNELSGSSELWDTADSWSTGLFDDAEEADEIFAGAATDDAKDSVSEEPDDRYPVAGDRDPTPEAREPDAAETEPPAPEAPGAKTPAAEVPAEEEEPEGHPAPQPAAQRKVTIREFFATLGEMRPPSPPDGSEKTTDETEAPPPESTVEKSMAEKEESYPYADDAFSALFENAPVDPEDSRAAAALSGAVAHTVPATPVTTSGERDSSSDEAAQPAKESEEDIRRFREWLEGLANS